MKNLNKKVFALAIIATLTFGLFLANGISTKPEVEPQIAYAGTLAGGEVGNAVGIVFGGSALVWGAIALVPGVGQVAGVIGLTYGL